MQQVDKAGKQVMVNAHHSSHTQQEHGLHGGVTTDTYMLTDTETYCRNSTRNIFPLSSTQRPQKMQSETCTKSGQWTDMTFHRKWKQILMCLHKAVFPLCLGPYLAFSQMSPDVVWDYCWNFFSCIYVMKQYFFTIVTPESDLLLFEYVLRRMALSVWLNRYHDNIHRKGHNPCFTKAHKVMRAVERRHLKQLCGLRDAATMVSSLQDSIYVRGKAHIHFTRSL